MDNITAIARTTYGRVAKSKALYLLWLILIGLIAAMNRYNILSMGREKMLIVDLGFALLPWVVAGSVLMVSGDIPRELRQKVAENLLSKPVGRDQYLIGKFLGTFFFALINLIIVTVGFVAVVMATKPEILPKLFQPLLCMVGVALVLSSAAAFFGTFLTEVPAVVATFLVFWLGHSTQIVLKLTYDSPNQVVVKIGQLIYGILPNLSLLDLRSLCSTGMFSASETPYFPWKYVAASLVYALLYSAVLFCSGMAVFRSRDI